MIKVNLIFKKFLEVLNRLSKNRLSKNEIDFISIFLIYYLIN